MVVISKVFVKEFAKFIFLEYVMFPVKGQCYTLAVLACLEGMHEKTF